MNNNFSQHFLPKLIELENIKLTSGPLDDYQRLFFATVLSKYFSEKPEDKQQIGTLNLSDYINHELRLRASEHKSNVSKEFNHPYYLTEAYNVASKAADDAMFRAAANGKAISQKAKKERQVFTCFEFKLPDLEWIVPFDEDENDIGSSTKPLMRLTSETIKSIPAEYLKAIALHPGSDVGQVLSANIELYSERPSDSKMEEDDINYKAIIAPIPAFNPLGHKTARVPQNMADDSCSFSMLGKNTAYSIDKFHHFCNVNKRLINKNNMLVWGSQSGFVFFTGIWRLYQDVMRGLILGQRGYKGNTTAGKAQEECRYEFEYSVSEAFYNTLEADLGHDDHSNTNPEVNKKRKKRSPRNGTPGSLNNIGVKVVLNDGISGSKCAPRITKSKMNPVTGKIEQVNEDDNYKDTDGNIEEPPKIVSKIKYNDVDWERLSPHLNTMIMDEFKQALVDEYHISGDIINHDVYKVSQLLQRIRGGYVKMQGTWLPMKLAKMICIRFCFPIRYMLVPMFGPDFPNECQEWYEKFSLVRADRIEQIKRDNHYNQTSKPASPKKRKLNSDPPLNKFVSPVTTSSSESSLSPLNKNNSTPPTRDCTVVCSPPVNSILHAQNVIPPVRPVTTSHMKEEYISGPIFKAKSAPAHPSVSQLANMQHAFSSNNPGVQIPAVTRAPYTTHEQLTLPSLREISFNSNIIHQQQQYGQDSFYPREVQTSPPVVNNITPVVNYIPQEVLDAYSTLPYNYHPAYYNYSGASQTTSSLASYNYSNPYRRTVNLPSLSSGHGLTSGITNGYTDTYGRPTGFTVVNPNTRLHQKRVLSDVHIPPQPLNPVGPNESFTLPDRVPPSTNRGGTRLPSPKNKISFLLSAAEHEAPRVHFQPVPRDSNVRGSVAFNGSSQDPKVITNTLSTMPNAPNIYPIPDHVNYYRQQQQQQ